MRYLHRRKLLVEADEDKRVIPVLLEANGIPWGETAQDAVVFIKAFGGVANLLLPDAIETEMKESGLVTLGIVVDVDEDAIGRWNQVKPHCDRAFSGLPVEIPPEGLIADNGDGLRLGVWIMPDNRSRGMLETFLAYLVPQNGCDLLAFAKSARDEARRHGATWKDAHADKVLIHSWLAWQDPPGHQLHTAVIAHQFQPRSDRAADFIAWFRTLYGL